MRAALLALVAAPLALGRMPGPQPGNLSIQGTASSALTGAPLAGARIVLSTGGPGRTLAYSDAAGHFRFDGLRAVPYNLSAFRTGYLQASQLVDLTPGRDSTAVRFELAPQALISGTVEDQDGFPVTGASIVVFTRGPQNATASASNNGILSDDRGRFRASGLASGRYFLHAEPGQAKTWDERYAAVYYPGALTFDGAEAIEVAPGQQRSGIAIRLAISGGVRVQGRVELPPGFSLQPGGPRAQVMLSTVGLPGFGRSTYVPLAEDGSFTLKNVQPGKYRLVPSLPPPYSRGFTTGPAEVPEPNLEVGSSDIAGIVLKVEDTAPLDVPGSLVFEAGTQPAPAVITLTRRGAVQAQTASLNDGSFVLRGVPPGRYRVDAVTVGGRARGRSARLGDADVSYGNLELKGPHPGLLVIAMSAAMAHAQGDIVDPAGRPLPGHFALFRAVEPGLGPAASAEADARGHFSAWLPPGEYRVWQAAAVPDGFQDGAADPPPGLAQRVTLMDGGNPPLHLAMPAAR
jgi:Carboxypeptidase regulatory-like domain